MYKGIVSKFGIKVRKLRLERGYSQEELGARAKLHRTYIGMVERGEKNATLESIEKIAKALNTSVSSLLE